MITTAVLEEITLAHQPYFPCDNRISYYNFSNIFMWRHAMHYQIILVGTTPCITGKYQDEPRMVLLPHVEEDDLLRDILFQLKAILDEPLRVQPLDHSMQKRIARLFPEAAFTDQRDLYDYLYRSDDLINLPGSKYHAKRNHIHAFTSTYSYEYVRITPDKLPLLRRCAEELYLKDSRLPDEYEAIGELLDHFEALHLRAGLLLAEGEPAAYSIGEKMCSDTALIHIEKADRSFEGAYAMINQLFSSDFADCLYINREEDMDIPGLRKAKLSYHPVALGEYCSAII